MDHPYPWLRYLDARQLENQGLKVNGLKVRNDAGETLGKLDGFIVDSETGRPYYASVDAGGWFKTKEFLVPIGHTRLDGDGEALVVDLGKERVKRFPGFDKNEFDTLTEADMKRMNDEICEICSVEVMSFSADEPYSGAWDRSHYNTPDWWERTATTHEGPYSGTAEDRQQHSRH